MPDFHSPNPRVNEELERLERLAGNQGRSVEEVISDAITHYLLRESDSLN
jgi:predicted transcriptional regulator